MRVVALFRVSTEKQKTEGSSLESQERRYNELAAQNGWETIGPFRGHESATQAAKDRRVLQDVLHAIQKFRPDALYVHEQSRLTRGDELEVALLMRELKENHVKIIVNGVVRDLSSIDERFMVGIQSLVDRTESERIKERLRRGKREKARNGKKVGGPAPYGYMNPPPGDPKRGTLQIVDAEAVVVRRIFDMASKGTGSRAIAKSLSESAIRSPQGKQWGKTTVERVLKCPAYIGTAASGVWVDREKNRTFRFDPKNPNAIVKENAHEAIIDPDTWALVHGRAPMARSPKPRLLSGMLWVDGQKAESDSGHGTAWYRPPRGVHGCAWLPANEVDERVWGTFVSLATGEEFVASLLQHAMTPHEKAVVEQEIEFLTGEVRKQQRRLDSYQTMYADGDLTKDQFRCKRDEATNAIATHEKEVERLRAQLAAMDGSQAARIVKAVQVLLRGRKILTFDQQRQILRSLVRRVDVTAQRIKTAFQRDARGHVVKGTSAPNWAVAKVSLTLALLPNGGEVEAVPQEPGTDDLQDRQLATTFLCSVLRGRARR
jgi:DNA invertase Pin-like site-specific DNA recombinase